ncbi:uncharacterized [Tachysurus ichikawai]
MELMIRATKPIARRERTSSLWQDSGRTNESSSRGGLSKHSMADSLFKQPGEKEMERMRQCDPSYLSSAGGNGLFSLFLSPC